MKHNNLRRLALILLTVTLVCGMLVSCDSMTDGNDTAPVDTTPAPTDMAGMDVLDSVSDVEVTYNSRGELSAPVETVVIEKVVFVTKK